MRDIRQSTAFKKDIFKKDIKRAASRPGFEIVKKRFAEIVALLSEDSPLPQQYLDHALTGQWAGHRECHLRPDVLLIYRLTDDDVLHLIRMGSHTDIL